jgi:hypothetical protein
MIRNIWEVSLFCIPKINEESSRIRSRIRIRIRIHLSEVRIRGSGSAPKFHGSPTLVAGDLDGGEWDRDAALLCVALRHRGEGDAGSRHTRRRQEQVRAPWALKGHLRKMIFYTVYDSMASKIINIAFHIFWPYVAWSSTRVRQKFSTYNLLTILLFSCSLTGNSKHNC